MTFASTVWISPEAFRAYTEILVAFIAGLWAYWRFYLGRQRATRLDIDLSYESFPGTADSHLVFIDVEFTNVGGVMLRAKPKRLNAYEDEGETLKFSGSVILRGLPADGAVNSQLSWFSSADQRSPKDGDIEIDLFDEYELGGETDFWIEPGEHSHCGVSVVLNKGTYLAMVTFLGSKDYDEFWRRTFVLRVPTQGKSGTEDSTAQSLCL